MSSGRDQYEDVLADLRVNLICFRRSLEKLERTWTNSCGSITYHGVGVLVASISENSQEEKIKVGISGNYQKAKERVKTKVKTAAKEVFKEAIAVAVPATELLAVRA